MSAPPTSAMDRNDTTPASPLDCSSAGAALSDLVGSGVSPVELGEPLSVLLGDELPSTRALSLESETKDTLMVAFLHVLGGSAVPVTKLAATH